jgi:enoyl-CoA hydratase/carnithine racemase
MAEMVATQTEFVKVAIDDRVATVTLDHPPVNAFNRKMLEELGTVMRDLAGDPAVKVIVLTAAGQLAFVAGADIGEIRQIQTIEDAQAFITLGQRTFTQIENMPKPVIAAITGLALGGGLELVMACHMRICGDRVQFGQPEIDLGIIPGWGGTQRLARIVGPAKATEIILTGRRIPAQEAYRLNLVNKVVPGNEVLKTARDLARVIAEKSAPAVSLALQAIGDGWRGNLEAGLTAEANAFTKLSIYEDWREGVAAFLEKRRPVFKDQ